MDTLTVRHTLLATALSTLILAPAANAADLTVTITQPATGTQYVGTFPALIPVTLSLKLLGNNDNCQTQAINKLTASAQLIVPEGADTPPAIALFTNVNPDITPENVNDDCTAPYSFTWSVDNPGRYNLLVTAEQGQTGDDDQIEFIALLELAAEYPAPPAIANAYINSRSDYKSAPGKKRGCIISKIAETHAKLSEDQDGYGPKGGPYDEAAIKYDVDLYYGGYGC